MHLLQQCSNGRRDGWPDGVAATLCDDECKLRPQEFSIAAPTETGELKRSREAHKHTQRHARKDGQRCR